MFASKRKKYYPRKNLDVEEDDTVYKKKMEDREKGQKQRLVERDSSTRKKSRMRVWQEG